MSYHLTVTSPFGHYKTGQRIEGADEVARILGSHHAKHVVKTAAPARAAVPASDAAAKTDTGGAKAGAAKK